MSRSIIVSPGPVDVAPEALSALASLHHRSRDFEIVVSESSALIRESLGTKHPVHFIAASGTGAMEAAVVNATAPGERFLAVSCGKFGDRWAEIAEAYDIPFEVLAKLLQTLARKGILVSRHGIRGGYSPARDPASITLREVMEAIEGPVALVECALPRRRRCGQEKKCRVRRPLVHLNRKVVEVLGRMTLEEL